MARAADVYRLRARFTRISGVEAVAFTIPVGDSQCRVVLNGWNGPNCGLDKIDGVSPPYGNPSLAEFTCETGVEYDLEIAVRCQNNQALIIVLIDEDELFRWQGVPSQLSLDANESLKHKDCFGLGTYMSVFRFSELRLGTERPTD